jgi:hypothetical protein
MKAYLASRSRVIGVVLVLALLTVCLGTSSASTVPTELEAEVSRFMKNVVSGHVNCYLDLVDQFTNPFFYEQEEMGILIFEMRVDQVIQEIIIPMLPDPVSSEFYQETMECLRQQVDHLVALFEAKNENLDDLEVKAAIRELAVEISQFELFVWYKIGIALLDGSSELEPIDAEAQITEWLSQSAYLDNAFQFHHETVIIFMNADMTWNDVVLQEKDGQWTAELSFFDPADESSGTCILTFTKQGETWKIARARTIYSF